MKKKLLLSLVITGFGLVFLLNNHQPVYAQEYQCIWDETISMCQPAPPYCTGEWTEPQPCTDYNNKDDCNGMHACELVPTPTPIPVGGECGCIFNGIACLDKTPSDCSPGAECVCEVIWGAIGPEGCEQGTCQVIPTAMPTPTGGLGQNGRCEVYLDPLLGCTFALRDCDPGFEPVASADCTYCTCEPISSIPPELQGGCPANHIDTALGCIPTDASEFAPWLIARGISLAGGVAFLLILFAGFQIITSSGDPAKLQAGRELLTAAITGLLLIIFSIFLLRIVGLEIFDIPGL